jgi:hypothetical protein
MHPHPLRSPYRGHRIGDLEHQPATILDVATVIVGALVCAILQELIEQISVCAMYRDSVEPGLLGRLGRPAERFNDEVDFRTIECARFDIGSLGA